MEATARCPACNTNRVAAFRYCRTCGYDFEGPLKLVSRGPLVTLPGLAAAPAPDGIAPSEREPTAQVASTVPVAERAADGSPAATWRGAVDVSTPGLQIFRGFFDSLDRATRRQLIRLVAEVGVLVVLVVVSGAMSPRSGPAPASGPLPGDPSGATLGMTADDAVRTFGSARVGSYTFTAAADGERLVGQPADGAATLVLFGDPADLRAVALTVEADATQELGPRQRRHVAAWLEVYAAGQLEYLLTSIDTALDTPEDSTVKVGTQEAEVRIETTHEPDGTTRVRLVLAPPSVPSPP